MMNDTEMTVRISDLLAMMLRAFKTILCLVLILGFLGGVYGAYSVAKTQPKVTQEDVEAAEKKMAAAESNLAKMQSALTFHNEVKIPGAIQKVERAERTVLQLQEYMENSIYYGMDPFHRGVARLRFAVDTDYVVAPELAVKASDPRIGIVKAYAEMCPFDAETMAQVRSIMGIVAPMQYLEELISVQSNNDYIVEIDVYYDDSQVAEKVVNHLFQTMTARGNEILPKHEIITLATYVGYEIDPSMSKSHASYEDSLTKAEKALLDATASYQAIQNDTSEEEAVADASAAFDSAQRALRNAKINYAKNRPSLRNMAKRAIKYGILGGLIGIVLGCCYALMKGLFGGIIQNQNEVMNRYSFPLIGVLPRTKKVWFDKTIRKLEGEPTGNFEATAQATAQSLLSRIGDRSVCIVSTGSSAIAQKLAAYTGEKVPVIGNIIDNAEAVKKLADYTGIVLVEERGKSRVDLVDAQVLRAKALNKEILGIVLA